MKGNGKIRTCTDMIKLNLSVKREVYPMATAEEILSRIQVIIFSKLDANSGFWQITLYKESWELTTFLIRWGRYYERKQPFDLTSATQIFCKEITMIIGVCKRFIVHVDDILVMGDSFEEHDDTLKSVLNRIEQAGMTLNKKKCVICVE